MNRLALVAVLGIWMVACHSSGTGHSGFCATDRDCSWRASGCCGACANQTDTLPPPQGCGIACPSPPPSCLCVDDHCEEGMLPSGAACEIDRDQCGFGLKCCPPCTGVPLPDAAVSQPSCVTPEFLNGMATCPTNCP